MLQGTPELMQSLLKRASARVPSTVSKESGSQIRGTKVDARIGQGLSISSRATAA